mmetsp:Transcript_3841/g.8226  ORF Transcript_3841/g.8226 Transcript_3841/m.8226 type:complete len:214 (+) Transcript_3841:293-934(+)
MSGLLPSIRSSLRTTATSVSVSLALISTRLSTRWERTARGIRPTSSPSTGTSAAAAVMRICCLMPAPTRLSPITELRASRAPASSTAALAAGCNASSATSSAAVRCVCSAQYSGYRPSAVRLRCNRDTAASAPPRSAMAVAAAVWWAQSLRASRADMCRPGSTSSLRTWTSDATRCRPPSASPRPSPAAARCALVRSHTMSRQARRQPGWARA